MIKAPSTYFGRGLYQLTQHNFGGNPPDNRIFEFTILGYNGVPAGERRNTSTYCLVIPRPEPVIASEDELSFSGDIKFLPDTLDNTHNYQMILGNQNVSGAIMPNPDLPTTNSMTDFSSDTTYSWIYASSISLDNHFAAKAFYSTNGTYVSAGVNRTPSYAMIYYEYQNVWFHVEYNQRVRPYSARAVSTDFYLSWFDRTFENNLTNRGSSSAVPFAYSQFFSVLGGAGSGNTPVLPVRVRNLVVNGKPIYLKENLADLRNGYDIYYGDMKIPNPVLRRTTGVDYYNDVSV